MVMFQSTSSEEDVVSGMAYMYNGILDYVSIHVLRRGRCVPTDSYGQWAIDGFNPRPPKRTLCLISVL